MHPNPVATNHFQNPIVFPQDERRCKNQFAAHQQISKFQPPSFQTLSMGYCPYQEESRKMSSNSNVPSLSFDQEYHHQKLTPTSQNLYRPQQHQLSQLSCPHNSIFQQQLSSQQRCQNQINQRGKIFLQETGHKLIEIYRPAMLMAELILFQMKPFIHLTIFQSFDSPKKDSIRNLFRSINEFFQDVKAIDVIQPQILKCSSLFMKERWNFYSINPNFQGQKFMEFQTYFESRDGLGKGFYYLLSNIHVTYIKVMNGLWPQTTIKQYKNLLSDPTSSSSDGYRQQLLQQKQHPLFGQCSGNLSNLSFFEDIIKQQLNTMLGSEKRQLSLHEVQVLEAARRHINMLQGGSNNMILPQLGKAINFNGSNYFNQNLRISHQYNQLSLDKNQIRSENFYQRSLSLSYFQNKANQYNLISQNHIRCKNFLDTLVQEGVLLNPEFKEFFQNENADFFRKCTKFYFKFTLKEDEIDLIIHTLGQDIVNGKCQRQHLHCYQTFFYLAIKYGPSYLQTLIDGFKKENISKWKLIVDKNLKQSKTGRPVRNIVFDKVTMSSLHKMIDEKMLPKFDKSMVKAMKKFLIQSNDYKMKYSKGWSRKYTKRYFKMIEQNEIEYLSHPLPEDYLLCFQTFYEKYLRVKSKDLRQLEKKYLYDWIDSQETDQIQKEQKGEQKVKVQQNKDTA